MKVFGWICIVIAAINLVVGIAAVGYGIEGGAGKFSGAVMVGALGGFLLWRSNKKQKEDDDQDKWAHQ